MYPASFEYFAPTSLDEALALLERFGDEGKVLAGGQSLIPLMKLRLAAPQAVIDINNVPELADTPVEENGTLRIGARVRHHTFERAGLPARFGTLTEAAPQISDPIVRNMGTVCGSVAHADPQGDWGSALIAMDAEVVTAAPGGGRTIPVSELFVGPFMTLLEPTEVVTEVRVPDPGARSGGAYLKLERKVGDFATVAVAVHVSMDNGTIRRAGIALTAVGPSNIRAKAAEDALAGRTPDDDLIREAARLAAEAAKPHDDHRGSAEYKRNIVRVYTERGLRSAIAEAGAAPEGG
ncbi:MAG: aerobic carbon-monoxide dehydrogenase medium subunit [Gaiellales bacterium]|nr:aerobic carbon-monoxide dehydrogenase medium subunit [Gaiellales bacterium]